MYDYMSGLFLIKKSRLFPREISKCNYTGRYGGF